jgi:hypothetical protein
VDEDRAHARKIGIPEQWWVSSRAWWDVRSIDTCPEHGVRLTDCCEACGFLLDWRRGLLDCRCGAEQRGRSAQAADPSVASYILARLSYACAKPVAILDGMSLVDAIRTMELLGAARLGWRAVRPRRSEDELPADRLHGLKFAVEWPAAFCRAVDVLVASRRSSSADGLMASYGWLYSEICVGDAPQAAAHLVAPILREHAVAHGIIARDEDRLRAIVPPTITATEAAKRIGRSYAKTRRLLEARDAVPDGSRRGVAFAIDPMIIASIVKSPISAPSARLRVGRSQARIIIRDAEIAGALEVEGRPAHDLVPALLDRAMREHVKGMIPLPLACRDMSVPLATACGSILSGQLRVARCGTIDDGLQAVLVSKTDLAQLRADSDRIGVEAVARIGSIHHEAARHLVRVGAFGACIGRKVDRAKVTRFFKEHVNASDLARSRGMSSARLARTLSALGVVPAYGPPTCRQLIYLRAALPTVH